MKRITFLLMLSIIVLGTCLTIGTANAQNTAVTPDGKVVILNTDGTWKYKDGSNSTNPIDSIIQTQVPSFSLIKANLSDYVDKEIIVYGKCLLESNLATDGYEKAQDLYYCIDVYGNNKEDIFVYFNKANNKKLAEVISASTHAVPMKLKIKRLSSKIKNSRGSSSGIPTFEGLSWEVLKK